MRKIITPMNKKQLKCLEKFRSTSYQDGSYLLDALECGPVDAQNENGNTVLHTYIRTQALTDNIRNCQLDEILSYKINPFIENLDGFTATGLAAHYQRKYFSRLHSYETAYRAEQDAIALAALGRLIQLVQNPDKNRSEIANKNCDLITAVKKLSGGRQRY